MKQPLLAVGHDVVHLHDLGLRGAPDPAVVEAAVGAGRVLVTRDTDFGELVARAGSHLPSIVLFRGAVTRRPDRQAALLSENLDQFEADLDAGAVCRHRRRSRAGSSPAHRVTARTQLQSGSGSSNDWLWAVEDSNL